MAQGEYIPEVDTSYGLVYRLNYLWAKVDGEALRGNYNAWEINLDRIFSNLLYREEVEVSQDGEKLIIKLKDKDISVWKQLKKNIKDAKLQRRIAVRKREHLKFTEAQEQIYFNVMMYDIWLRKFMHNTLRLYMRESQQHPSGALFGGKFGKFKGKG